MPRFSFVIPYFNKAEALGALSAQIRELSSRLQGDSEFIVVDDGSRPADAERLSITLKELSAEGVSARMLRLPQNQGKGAALVAGSALAIGESLIFMDADAAFGIAEVEKILTASAASPAAVIVADRRRAHSVGQSRLRDFLSRAFRHGAKRILAVPVNDIQAGLKALPRSWFCARPWRCRAFALDIEILREARRENRLIIGVPVTEVSYERGKSSVAILKTAIELGAELLGPLGSRFFYGGLVAVLLLNLRAFSLRSSVPWDARDEMWIYFRWLGSALRAGHFADFFPNIVAGYPVGANIQSGTYNPFYLAMAYLFPDSALSINFVYVLLQFAIYTAAFLLAHSLRIGRAAGMFFALSLVASGFVIGHASHFSYLSTFAAWIFAFLALRLVSLGHFFFGGTTLAAAVFSMATTGYPAIMLFGTQVFIVLLALCLWKQSSRAKRTQVFWVLLFSVGIGLLFSIPSLWHFINQYRNWGRREGVGIAEVMHGVYPMRGWLNFLNPLLRMENLPDAVDLTMDRFHLLFLSPWLVVLSFFAAGKNISRNWHGALFAAALLCTVLAFGSHSGLPLREWLAEHVFFYRSGRFPSGEHGPFALIGWALLAALGFDLLWSRMKRPSWRAALLFLLIFDFTAIMGTHIGYRYTRLPEDLRGKLPRYQVTYTRADQSFIDAPRGCPFDARYEFDERMTVPNKFSWNGYTNLIPETFMREREQFKTLFCGPSRLWQLASLSPQPYELEVYSPGKIKFRTKTKSHEVLVWADLDDGFWRLWVNGQSVPFEQAPAKMRGIDTRHFPIGSDLEIEMRYLGPLSRLWRAATSQATSPAAL